MSPFEQAFWTILVATAASVPCAILGCFLLLKRMSLLADAIGHGVLPGIALAVMLTGNLNSIAVILGATFFGLLTALLAQGLASRLGVSEDTSLGVVFTALFATGVLLISRYLDQGHVDLHCVAFSVLEFAPMFPETLIPLAALLAVVVAFVALFWKELKLATFDPGLARTLGMPVALLHYGLVALVAATTVAAFESFGSILILGMFVLPAATARLFTDRLAAMVVAAAGLAFTACVLGYVLASPEALACNAAGMIVVVAGAQFGLAVLAAPRHGLIAQLSRKIRLARRMAREEVLATLYRREEASAGAAALTFPEHRFSPWIVHGALRELRRRGLIQGDASALNLTEPGRDTARSVVRAHRLWELYLERNFELPLDHLHLPASQMEHYLGPEVVSDLAVELAAPDQDPHGREIPK